MRLLLDTHIFLWWSMEHGARLSTVARDLLSDGDNDVAMSMVSAWEIAIKVGAKRMDLPDAVERYLPDRIRHHGFEVMPIDMSHVFRAGVAPTDPPRPVRSDAHRTGADRRHPDPDGRPGDRTLRRRDDLVTAATKRPKARARPRKRRFSDPGRTWARQIERYRPGLVPFVLDELAARYGRPTWQRRLDPTSELILTILTQNSADTNAEVAFEALRAEVPGYGRGPGPQPGRRLGRRRPARRDRAGLGRHRIRATPRTGRHDPAWRARQPEGATPPGDPHAHPRGTRRLLPRIPRRPCPPSRRATG